MQNKTYLVVTQLADDLDNELEEEFTCRTKAKERYNELSWEHNTELWECTSSFNDVENIINNAHRIC